MLFLTVAEGLGDCGSERDIHRQLRSVLQQQPGRKNFDGPFVQGRDPKNVHVSQLHVGSHGGLRFAAHPRKCFLGGKCSHAVDCRREKTTRPLEGRGRGQHVDTAFIVCESQRPTADGTSQPPPVILSLGSTGIMEVCRRARARLDSRQERSDADRHGFDRALPAASVVSR